MNDKTRLQLFIKRVEELKSTRLVREGFDSGFSVNWTAESGVMNFTFQQPDEDLFKALLVSVRHFLLEKEPAFINRIYNISHLRITNQKHKEYLAKSREFFEKALKSTGVHLNIDNKHYSPSYVWDVYVNGLYFHSDQSKFDSLSKLSEHEKNMAKNELYGFINACIKQIIYVSSILEKAFENDELCFEESI